MKSSSLFPKKCLFCQLKTHTATALCKTCEALLPYPRNPCVRCGFFLPLSSSTPCGKCLMQPPAFDGIYALFSYENPIASLIQDIKFQEHFLIAHGLGEMLGAFLKKQYEEKPLPEVIIPVPLHPQRLKHRGFNQALELAKPLKKILNIPLDPRACTRKKNTAPQATLSASQRGKNIKDAFHIHHTSYKSIALVNDVITTGNTLHDLAQGFKREGTSHIVLWCLAQTPP